MPRSDDTMATTLVSSMENEWEQPSERHLDYGLTALAFRQRVSNEADAPFAPNSRSS